MIIYQRHVRSGFTLIELMVCVAVIAILSLIAVPSYQQYVVRASRAAAQAEMMDIAAREQEYFMANRSYGDLEALGFTLSDDVAARYTPEITVESAPIPRYTIVFVPKNGQSGDGSISLDSEGVKTPAEKW